MTTNADFMQAILAAILADPTDDGPRLVYADWLEEQGNGEEPRAELIRAQCALGALEREAEAIDRRDNIGMGWALPEEKRGKLDALRRRADELLARHGEDWLPDLARCRKMRDLMVPYGTSHPLGWAVSHGGGGESGIAASFRRGFVAEVTLSAEAWLGGVCQRCQGEGVISTGRECGDCALSGRTPGHADALCAATPLEVVRLTTWPQRSSWHPGHFMIQGVACDQEAVKTFLAQKWPTIRFELPAQPVHEWPVGYEPTPEEVEDERERYHLRPDEHLAIGRLPRPR